MLRNKIKFIFFLFGLVFAFTARAQTVSELFHHPGDPVVGNPKGEVTVVEFFDYQCSHCMNMASVVDAIKKNNPDLRIVFKDFPIRGAMSEFAARAALAANNQGKYYAFSHALLTSPDQPLTKNTVFAIAKKVGLDTKKLKKDMNSSNVTSVLSATNQLAQDLKLRGTPAFVFGKTKDGSNLNYVLGEMTQTEMQEAIDKVKQ